MGATTTEGTGPGAVNNIKPLILNGMVNGENIVVNALSDYRIDINAEGDISAEGTIRGMALGQLLNTSLYTFSSGNVSNAGVGYTDLASVSYTPASDSSALVIEYHAAYTVSGSATDTWRSRILVDGSEVTYRTQVWVNVAGQDVRSGVLFPIAMKVDNSTTTAKVVKVQAARTAGDDTLTVDTNSGFLRISEYAV